jgi:hypothetical protein
VAKITTKKKRSTRAKKRKSKLKSLSRRKKKRRKKNLKLPRRKVNSQLKKTIQSTWSTVDVSIIIVLFNFVLECGLPPEFCTFGQKDASGCKEWLGERYPQLF